MWSWLSDPNNQATLSFLGSFLGGALGAFGAIVPHLTKWSRRPRLAVGELHQINFEPGARGQRWGITLDMSNRGGSTAMGCQALAIAKLGREKQRECPLHWAEQPYNVRRSTVNIGIGGSPTRLDIVFYDRDGGYWFADPRAIGGIYPDDAPLERDAEYQLEIEVISDDVIINEEWVLHLPPLQDWKYWHEDRLGNENKVMVVKVSSRRKW